MKIKKVTIFVLAMFLIAFTLTGCVKPSLNFYGLLLYKVRYLMNEEGKVQAIGTVKFTLFEKMELIILKEVEGNKVEEVFAYGTDEDGFKDNEKISKIYWEGGFPFEWDKYEFKSNFINVFWSEQMPEWLKTGEHYLPGKIACPKIFRENYGNCYEPKRSIVYHYNYEDSENSDVYWYDFLFEDGNKREKDSFLTEIPKPQREGYNFTQWYKEPECINPIRVNYNSNIIQEEKELQVYAGWKKRVSANSNLDSPYGTVLHSVRYRINDEGSVQAVGTEISASYKKVDLIILKEVEGFKVEEVFAYGLNEKYGYKGFKDSEKIRRIYWEGGFPFEWDKYEFKSNFINIFWSEQMPEWLKTGEHYLPGKIACPKIFRENYGNCYEPKRSIVYHYNYEGSENSDVYWYDFLFEGGDGLEGSVLTVIPEPQRKGYNFTQWYKEPECINPIIVNFNPSVIEEEKELQVYAGWEKSVH